jgi:hypothetical protein
LHFKLIFNLLIGIPLLTDLPRSQAFQFKYYIKIVLELFFVFQYFLSAALNIALSKLSVVPLLIFGEIFLRLTAAIIEF